MNEVGEKVDTILTEEGVPLELQKPYEDEAPEGELAKRWIELGGDQGTRIRAIAPGAVEEIAGATLSHELRVRGDDGTLYLYGHLEAPIVHQHQRVTAGQTLAHIALDPGQNAHVRLGVVKPEEGPVDPLPLVLKPAAVRRGRR